MTFLTKHVVIIIVMIALGEKAHGRNKPAQVHLENKYDQKQLGDYNVHLHLNDLKVIAIVGSRGSAGDYDYNYDYSDFTVKPSDISGSDKPQASNSSENNTAEEKPTPTTSSSISVSPTKPVYFTTANKAQATTAKVETTGSSQSDSSTQSVDSATEKKKSESAITNISILPAENTERSRKPHLPRGPALRFKKCGQGYSRDKQGRCRKIRRNTYVPISRLASNLVKKLKQQISRKSE